MKILAAITAIWIALMLMLPGAKRKASGAADKLEEREISKKWGPVDTNFKP